MRQIRNPSSYQKSWSHLFVLLSGCVMTVAVWSCFAALLLATGCTAPLPADSRSVGQPSGFEKIRHVIVIYQENWSFDGLYGKFPGADGIANAGERIRQMKKDGTPYTTLPQPLDTSKNPPIPDLRFRADLPVAPYDAARYVPADQKTGDIVNRALQQERQINGGRSRRAGRRGGRWVRESGRRRGPDGAVNGPPGARQHEGARPAEAAGVDADHRGPGVREGDFLGVVRRRFE